MKCSWVQIIWLVWYPLLLGAQDSLRAQARVRGDFVEVDFWWRGTQAQVPIAANFVLFLSPRQALAWQAPEITQRGMRDALFTPDYQALYLTYAPENANDLRVSFNLMPTQVERGIPFTGTWERIGAWRMPILQFGDTLRLRWGMESGEIVLLPRVPSKDRFVYEVTQTLFLCPLVTPARIGRQGSSLGIELPGEFRPENLQVLWYRDGVRVGEGLSHEPLLSGAYYAEVRHVCGSAARTDSVLWRTTALHAYTQSGWRIYPQPAHSELWIESPTTTSASFVLYDATGKEVFSYRWEAVAQQAHRLTLPALPAGSYYIRLLSEAESLTLPLLYAP
ncbi:MAG: T9SS type A sorting domain-containing protein [Bacteroidia bacterium]|nr:T9SS type A sorting domain-containing protein [Bacteroidia bacterium]MDW8235082.1 T9SS type A sorting domain-containing protein [Bacteroidia bacterium]